MKAVAVDIASIVRRCFCCGRTRHRYTQINTKLEAEKNVMTIPSRGPFICYGSTFLGFLDPPPPLRNHVSSTENGQKISDPPSPPTSDYVIYEWSHIEQYCIFNDPYL